MKDHLSEIHPNKKAFICQITKADDLTNHVLTAEICLRDLFDEHLTRVKKMRLKLSSEARHFYEKQKNKRRKKRKLKKKPFLMITEAYSVAKK